MSQIALDIIHVLQIQHGMTDLQNMLQGICGCVGLTDATAGGGSPAEVKSELRQFRQNEEIVLQVICKKDATEKLEEKIPYGLAVNFRGR